MEDVAEPKEHCSPCIEDGMTVEDWLVMHLSDGSCSENSAMVVFLKASESYLTH